MSLRFHRLTTRRTVITTATVLVGAGLITVCAVRLWDWYATTRRLQLPSPKTVVTHSSSKPNEAPIDAQKVTYTTAADQPRLIEIPAINVSGLIQPVGTTQDEAIATPQNINMAGWYTGSTKPGEKGVSVIDGHVRGRYRPAIFRDLNQLKSGDSIAVTYGDGRQVDFSVVQTKTYSLSEAAAHIFDHLPSVERELVLITCTGTYDQTNRTYDHRVLVYAKQVVN